MDSLHRLDGERRYLHLNLPEPLLAAVSHVSTDANARAQPRTLFVVFIGSFRKSPLSSTQFTVTCTSPEAPTRLLRLHSRQRWREITFT